MTLLARAAAVLALGLALGLQPAADRAARAADAPAAQSPVPAPPVEMTLGDPKAKVKVIEYASVVCPHCARFNAEVFPAFKAKYVDTGKVLYAFREFPTEPVNVAAAGFLVARCAPAGRYFAVLDALFEGQAKLFESRDVKQYLLDAGKVGGLDEAKIEACLNDETAVKAFNTRVQTAFEKAKISATPTFVIGDKTLTGEQTLAQLDAVIEPMLAAK